VRLSLAVALLMAVIAGALLMAAAGTARITQLWRVSHRGRPAAPATPGRQATAPSRKEQRPC